MRCELRESRTREMRKFLLLWKFLKIKLTEKNNRVDGSLTTNSNTQRSGLAKDSEADNELKSRKKATETTQNVKIKFLRKIITWYLCSSFEGAWGKVNDYFLVLILFKVNTKNVVFFVKILLQRWNIQIKAVHGIHNCFKFIKSVVIFIHLR